MMYSRVMMSILIVTIILTPLWAASATSSRASLSVCQSVNTLLLLNVAHTKPLLMMLVILIMLNLIVYLLVCLSQIWGLVHDLSQSIIAQIVQINLSFFECQHKLLESVTWIDKGSVVLVGVSPATRVSETLCWFSMLAIHWFTTSATIWMCFVMMVMHADALGPRLCTSCSMIGRRGLKMSIVRF